MDSDSEASNHSSSPRSLSPAQQSPSTSSYAEPSLQRLTTHFVTAKRSLSTTHHVFRANELVTSSRKLVEEVAVLNARNEYATRAAEEGVRVLEDTKWAIEQKGDDAESDFTRVIEGLDEANGRLLATLETLRGTAVEASLQRQPEETKSNASDDPEDVHQYDQRDFTDDGKTLLSFIDTSKHETIQAALRNQIDDFNATRGDLSSSLDTFAKDIHVLHTLLSPPPASPEPPELLRPALYDEPPPTVPQLFHTITDNAGAMASLLESLVSHYDLCVTALKHTEGGGQAARKAVEQQRNSTSPMASNDALPQSKENLEESLYHKDHASHMSAEERQEMLKVLEHDSQEVEDVVSELSEHARDLESAFDKLSIRARKSRERGKTLNQVITMLHEMQNIHIPSHLHSLETFSADWTRIRATILSNTEQLVELSDFYADFFDGYKKLLREIERRQVAETQMRRIAEKAEREIGKVWDADDKARGAFMEEVGGVLPRDLWPSLHKASRRWEVVEVGEAGGAEG